MLQGDVLSVDRSEEGSKTEGDLRGCMRGGYVRVDYVLVIQSSAFKPGSGSFHTVQSRT